LGLIGALIGFVFSLAHPPRYQAEAVLGVTINYGITEPLELVVEDRVLNRVVALLKSNDTLERVLDRLPGEVRDHRGWARPVNLRESLRLDKRLAEWGLVVVDEDPQLAMEVAQQWATVSLQILDEAVEHAWKAAALLGGPFDVDCYPVEIEGAMGPVVTWRCQVTPLELDPDALEGALRTEIDLSHGVLPIISYELLREPRLPNEPIQWGRGLLMGAGAVVGLILGFGLTLSPLGLYDRWSSMLRLDEQESRAGGSKVNHD
jgi:hypothetical protein